MIDLVYVFMETECIILPQGPLGLELEPESLTNKDTSFGIRVKDGQYLLEQGLRRGAVIKTVDGLPVTHTLFNKAVNMLKDSKQRRIEVWYKSEKKSAELINTNSPRRTRDLPGIKEVLNQYNDSNTFTLLEVIM